MAGSLRRKLIYYELLLLKESELLEYCMCVLYSAGRMLNEYNIINATSQKSNQLQRERQITVWFSLLPPGLKGLEFSGVF